MSDTASIGERLREPFPLESLGWKPQAVKGNRALAVAYIDARDVMQRLDDAVGVENWQDEYTFLPGGQVMCHLKVCFGGVWVTKCDVGGESEQPDKGDREKAAVSDALKRAAVKFGIGRYLYSMPSQWCDYDPVKREFVQTPRVAPQFLPAKPSARSQQSAAPPSLFKRHAESLRAAKTLDDLKNLMGAVNDDRNQLSKQELIDLTKLKDDRKLELTKPKGEATGALFDAGTKGDPTAAIKR